MTKTDSKEEAIELRATHTWIPDVASSTTMHLEGYTPICSAAKRNKSGAGFPNFTCSLVNTAWTRSRLIIHNWKHSGINLTFVSLQHNYYFGFLVHMKTRDIHFIVALNRTKDLPVWGRGKQWPTPARSKHNSTLLRGDPVSKCLNVRSTDRCDNGMAITFKPEATHIGIFLLLISRIVSFIKGTSLLLNKSRLPSICSLKNVGGRAFLNSASKLAAALSGDTYPKNI